MPSGARSSAWASPDARPRQEQAKEAVEWAGGDSRLRRARRKALGLARWARVVVLSPRRAVVGECELGPRSSVRVVGVGRVSVGREVVIAADFECYVQGQLIMGDEVYIGRWGVVSALESVSIGSRVRIGERVSIHDENHSSSGDDYVAAGVTIEDDVWIGANVTVLAGVRVGRGAVVGAGSTITRDVEPATVVAGTPARVIRPAANQ